MNQIQTRGGIFGAGGYGGGVFDGSHSGLGELPFTVTGKALGLIDPKGQSWNTPTYQACVGVAIQKCGEKAYQNSWPESQLNDCMDTAQMQCIAQAKSSASTALSSSQVSALQTKINAALTKSGYCPIAVDGKLGPITCGSAAWAVAVDPSIVVPGACGKTITMGSNFLKECPSGETPQPSPPPPPPKQPQQPLPPPQQQPVQPLQKKASNSTAWIVGGLAATAVVVGVAIAAKKK
jgi:hypothetical protein